MNTFEEFKEFIKNKPYLKEKVKNNETTWQELYERYDLYGKDDEIFKDEEPIKKEETKEKDEKDDSLSSFINMISGLDVDKISDGLNGMKKILNILSEITVNDETSSFSSARRNQRPYKIDDD
mgnify:CR=1 FL=1